MILCQTDVLYYNRVNERFPICVLITAVNQSFRSCPAACPVSGEDGGQDYT